MTFENLMFVKTTIILTSPPIKFFEHITILSSGHGWVYKSLVSNVTNFAFNFF